MELKDIYKDKEIVFALKDRKITIKNDKKLFPLYKKLKLPVFKSKKKSDSISKK